MPRLFFGHIQMLKVVGDHRVGIFSKSCIEVSVGLFFDYGYTRDQTHVLALKPGDPKEGVIS